MVIDKLQAYGCCFCYPEGKEKRTELIRPLRKKINLVREKRIYEW